ncbi:MAG: HPr family phosphocarrier protein [Chitinispirillaceae bacterium]|jgi:phosphotransferase system HPr (HPr) family protein
MRSKKVIVQNEHGIHARVALAVLEKSKGLDSQVTICKGCEKADGCSILELLLLGAEKGSEIELIVTGGDEEKSIKTISEIFSDGSGI